MQAIPKPNQLTQFDGATDKQGRAQVRTPCNLVVSFTRDETTRSVQRLHEPLNGLNITYIVRITGPSRGIEYPRVQGKLLITNIVADVFTPEQRSRCMARIRSSRNKSTELKMISILRAHRITGWRRNQQLPGKPDFVFRKPRLALFVDGCFWHGCKTHARIPQANRSYWTAKIDRNTARDRQMNLHLRHQGWRVLRVWEHELARPDRVARKLQRLVNADPRKPRLRILRPSRLRA